MCDAAAIIDGFLVDQLMNHNPIQYHQLPGSTVPACAPSPFLDLFVDVVATGSEQPIFAASGTARNFVITRRVTVCCVTGSADCLSAARIVSEAESDWVSPDLNDCPADLR
jgi:hypothetical protein